jgi:hypothetical protein
MNVYQLTADTPGCPKGSIFKQSYDGVYKCTHCDSQYYSVTQVEESDFFKKIEYVLAPKKGKVFWYWDSIHDEIEHKKWKGEGMDFSLFKVGNVFLSHHRAKQARQRLLCEFRDFHENSIYWGEDNREKVTVDNDEKRFVLFK